MRKTFRLVLEGKASNGGFAIDQLTFNPGDCPSRNAFTFSSELFSPQTVQRAPLQAASRGPKFLSSSVNCFVATNI